ncbi:hypothetical protein CAter282_0074 [Collimonas arenae]|uniref:Uncharacterized protein n=1 Tax=Collimonas arenae TaxID=279058 RepID=A0A127PJP8_9BURK|nr:hypothetical protein [Collimonas arenae]AMO98036.1 hypothetical protein CAter10_0078 [Collimonas arenae]AMP07899.1 hypothetical protein CAter282_0074 [Collimonas arenae]
MNYAPTSCQVATTLPCESLAAQSRSERLAQAFGQVAIQVSNWWQQRLLTPSAQPPINMSEMSDHLLRDIGYIDVLPPRKQSNLRRDQ